MKFCFVTHTRYRVHLNDTDNDQSVFNFSPRTPQKLHGDMLKCIVYMCFKAIGFGKASKVGYKSTGLENTHLQWD